MCVCGANLDTKSKKVSSAEHHSRQKLKVTAKTLKQVCVSMFNEQQGGQVMEQNSRVKVIGQEIFKMVV